MTRDGSPGDRDGSGSGASGKTGATADSDGDSVVPETTQSASASEVLAFLRADALAVYDDLSGADREWVDRRRRGFRDHIDPETSIPEAGRRRLLTGVAVDLYRARVALGYLLRAGLTPGQDATDGAGSERTAAVVDELCRLSRRRSDRLRRLGVYPTDRDTGGETAR
jgi:hypothetical protein